MKQSKYYFAIFIIIFITIFMRFYLLQNQSLWFDEGWSLRLSDGTSFQENLSNIIGREAGDKYQPLYYLLLFYWRSVFGDSEFAIRSLSALLGVGSVITIFFTSLRIYGKKHALWSSMIIAVSSFGVFYSQDARPYALLIFIASLQIFLFTHIINQDNSNKIISQVFFGLITAIGMFGSILIVIFSAALCLSHIIVYRNLKQWIQWWATAAVFSFPMIWFYLSSPAASDPTSTGVTRSGLPIFQNAMFVIYGILVGTSYGPPIEQLRGDDRIRVVLSYWPQLLLLLIVITLILTALLINLVRRNDSKKNQRTNYLFACLLIISFVFAFIFAELTKINWLPRHSFYLFIPIIIIIPLAFSENYQHQTKLYILSQFAKIATVVLIIMNIYSSFKYYLQKDYAKDDYRSAVQYLLQNQDKSAKSILLWGEPRLLKYYGDSSTLYAGSEILEKVKGKNLAEKVSNITNNVNTVFVMVNREFFWGPKGAIKREMSDLYNLESETSWPYVKIYKFVKKK
ncbi:glycosyltransferase family 39 protein [Nostoc ellipsosporum NOK]|nr:glycosyltransferase family 39 protein [Nostoc ellipsosporum NOK]